MQTSPDLESIFAEAIELADPVRQGDYLDRACVGDAGLRNRVKALLSASRRSDSFMDEPASIFNLADEPFGKELLRESQVVVGEQAGDVVGRYKLIEQIGEGGMGRVFLADQHTPVQRQVAVKIVKPGLDTKEVIARFEVEQQALAMMDHPHIARVLDAGATDSGRPFFVMELVQGTSLTEHCRQANLSLNERLELIRSVCGAIQHAHQKGIIHRDLKPRNVMVTTINGKAVPKVIDFGIAKAVDQTLTEKTLQTSVGQFIGTPAYMSPEQATSNVDIDTRTDVYSLGAMLYELITGVAPFDQERLKTMGHDELRRVIAEETPPVPSAQISTLQANRGITDQAKKAPSSASAIRPREIKRAIHGELDWVVMRAMEKDRDRRYATVTALADDLQRFLANEPIVARPPSTLYQWRKFVLRNRVLVASGFVVAVTLLAATCASAWWAVAARDANRNTDVALARVRTEVERLDGVLAFLNDDLFGQADPLNEANPNITLRSTLDRAATKLAADKSKPLHVQAPIRTSIGETYRRLGEYAAAIEHLKVAENIYRQLNGDADATTISAANRLSRALLSASRFSEAKLLVRNTLQQATESLDANDAQLIEAKKLQAWWFDANGEPEQAEQLLQEALDWSTTNFGKHSRQAWLAQSNLARAYRSQGRLTDALKLLQEAYDGFAFAEGHWDPVALRVSESYASALTAAGRTDEARSIYEVLIPAAERSLPQDHHQTLIIENGLSTIDISEQRWDEAERRLRETLAAAARTLPKHHRTTLLTLHKLAGVLVAQHETAEAESLYKQELAGLQVTVTTDHPAVFDATSSLAFLYVNDERFADAIPLYERATAVLRQKNSDGINTYAVSTMLGFCRYQSGDLSGAKTELLDVLQRCEDSIPDHWLRYVTESLLGEVLFKLDDRMAAEDALLRGYQGLKIHAVDVPYRWSPLGLRAATRRLLEFYEAADTDEMRALAAPYRDQVEQLNQTGQLKVHSSSSEQDLTTGSTEDGNPN